MQEVLQNRMLIKIFRIEELYLLENENDQLLNIILFYGCAIDDSLFVSGGKFDTLTKTCTKLSQNWFLNPTFEANNSYFRLIKLEHLTPKNVTLIESMPTISFPGGSVILDIVSSSSPTTGSMWVDFRGSDNKIVFFQKFQPNMWCFDVGNRVRHCINNVITQPNRAYKLAYVFTKTTLELYLDGSLEYIFGHRFAVDGYQRFILSYISDDKVFTCKRIVYRY